MPKQQVDLVKKAAIATPLFSSNDIFFEGRKTQVAPAHFPLYFIIFLPSLFLGLPSTTEVQHLQSAHLQTHYVRTFFKQLHSPYPSIQICMPSHLNIFFHLSKNSKIEFQCELFFPSGRWHKSCTRKGSRSILQTLTIVTYGC